MNYAYLLATYGATSWTTNLAPGFPQNLAPVTEPADQGLLVLGMVKGVGQIFLADTPATGALILVGMLIASPLAAIAALLGSVLGTLVGFMIGAPLEELYFGLWGYNSSLAAVAVFVFFLPSRRVCLLMVWCAVTAALLTPTIASLLAPLG